LQLVSFGVANLAMFVLSIIHTVLVYRDQNDHWDKLKSNYDNGNCVPKDFGRCVCNVDAVDKTLRKIFFKIPNKTKKNRKKKFRNYFTFCEI